MVEDNGNGVRELRKAKVLAVRFLFLIFFLFLLLVLSSQRKQNGDGKQGVSIYDVHRQRLEMK